MEETILALLVATFPGVRKDGLKMLARTLALQAETEADAKAAVERLTREGVDGFVRDYRAEVDKAVSDGTHTFEENLKRKFDLVEKKELPEEPAGKGKDNPDPKPNGKEADLRMIVAEAVAGAVKPLQERLEQYERGDVNRTRLQAVTERLNACKDESFRAKALKDYGRMTFDTDEAFQEYLSDTETDVAEANKRVADAKLSAMGRPMFAQKTETGVTAGVARYIDAQTKGGDASLGGDYTKASDVIKDIDKSDPKFDVITLAATIGAASEGDVLVQAKDKQAAHSGSYAPCAAGSRGVSNTPVDPERGRMIVRRVCAGAYAIRPYATPPLRS